MKISIVIPTYNHCNDLLKPCIDSILKYTNLIDIEVIVSANGCKDNTKEYVESLGRPFKLVWNDNAIGYSKAINVGIEASSGEYILLLNNDIILLEQEKHTWINLLLAPFYENDSIGITGPLKSYSPHVNREFIVFFCALVRRELFNKLGLLDTIFGVGGGEDIDFCIKVENIGHKTIQVPFEKTKFAGSFVEGSFPIYHVGEGTVHDKKCVNGWSEKLHKNFIILAERYNPSYIIEMNKEKDHLMLKNVSFDASQSMKVTAEIITKNRYSTTLPLCISSLITQTHKLHKILIIDDSDNKIDLRRIPIYQHLFFMLDFKGIHWEVLFPPKTGIIECHELALDASPTEFIWRVDDDCIVEPNVLEELVSAMDDKTGAVAGLIINPSLRKTNPNASNDLYNIENGANEQWFIPSDMSVKSVDHLYSSFLYRKSAASHGYCKELSPVGHREETIFSHEMKLNGWDLKINPKALTHHLMNPEGGIRSYHNGELWGHDEEIFKNKLNYWKLIRSNPDSLTIVLDNGIGDHFAFKSILKDVIDKHNHIIISCCYPNAFYDFQNLNLVSICSVPNNLREKLNVYKFMQKKSHPINIVDAFRELYLGKL